MNREPKRTPISTREWFSGLVYHVGKSVVSDIWNVSHRSVELWSADKATTEVTSKDPAERLLDSMDKVQERGKDDFARSLADIFAAKVGCHLVCSEEAMPDKETIHEELLDDITAVTELHHSIINREPEAVVRDLLSKAKRELDEDYQAYLKHM